MNVQVRLFAAARQATRRDCISVEMPQGATVAQLRRRMEREFPELSGLLRHATFAINAEYSTDAGKILPHDEVACIPPVSGG